MLDYENRVRTVKRLTATVDRDSLVLFTCDYPHIISHRPDEFMIEDQIVVNGLVEAMSGVHTKSQYDVEGILRHIFDDVAVMIQHLDNEGPSAEFISNATLEVAISPDYRKAMVQIIRPERGSMKASAWYSREE